MSASMAQVEYESSKGSSGAASDDNDGDTKGQELDEYTTESFAIGKEATPEEGEVPTVLSPKKKHADEDQENDDEIDDEEDEYEVEEEDTFGDNNDNAVNGVSTDENEEEEEVEMLDLDRLLFSEDSLDRVEDLLDSLIDDLHEEQERLYSDPNETAFGDLKSSVSLETMMANVRGILKM